MISTPTLANPAAFRQALGRLAAGTTVVTLTDAHGVQMGFTATAVSSVSLEPPLVLVCVSNKSRTIEPLSSGRPFVLNFLTAQQQALAMQFASLSPHKFADVDYTISPNGTIHLSDVLASIECVPHHVAVAGDHTVVIGLVTETRIGADDSPLVYFRSQFI